MELDDGAFVEGIRSRDSEALGTLYDLHSATALAVALRIVGDRDTAEDVVHDTFVAVWQKIDLFRLDRGSLRSWILGIARNRAIDRRRGSVPRIELSRADDFALLRTTGNPTLDEVLGRLSREELRGALEELPPEQRTAIDLAYFRGHTYREIAAITGVPQGTANTRLRLALIKLRDRLGGSRPPAAIAVESGVAVNGQDS